VLDWNVRAEEQGSFDRGWDRIQRCVVVSNVIRPRGEMGWLEVGPNVVLRRLCDFH